MNENPGNPMEETRFDLQVMLKELEVENAQHAPELVTQSEILHLFKNQKKRDRDD